MLAVAAAKSSPMAAMPATSCATRSLAWAGQPSRSSSTPMPLKASRSCPAHGSWNGPSHDAGDAAVSPGTGKLPSRPQLLGRSLLPSACSSEEPQVIDSHDNFSTQALKPVRAVTLLPNVCREDHGRGELPTLFWQDCQKMRAKVSCS